MFPQEIHMGDRTYEPISPPTEDGAFKIPKGYSLYRVKRWDEYPMVEDGYSAYLRGNVGQFQVVSPYIFDANNVWCGTLSSNTNFSVMRRADIFKLANHQLLDSGYEWGLSDEEIISLLNVPLRDGYTLKQKMGWMIWTNMRWGGQMRSDGDWYDWLRNSDGGYRLDENRNKQEVVVQMIAIVHGGQQVLMSDKVTYYKDVEMRSLLTFKREYFGLHYDKYPFLMQRATVASTPNNVYGEFPKGAVYCPVALSPEDFKFYTTRFTPVDYRLPTKHIVKL